MDFDRNQGNQGNQGKKGKGKGSSAQKYSKKDFCENWNTKGCGNNSCKRIHKCNVVRPDGKFCALTNHIGANCNHRR